MKFLALLAVLVLVVTWIVAVPGCAMIGWHVPDAKEGLEVTLPNGVKAKYLSALDTQKKFDEILVGTDPNTGKWTFKMKGFGWDSKPSDTYRGFGEGYVTPYGQHVLGPGGVQGIIAASGQAGANVAGALVPFVSQTGRRGVFVPQQYEWIQFPETEPQPTTQVGADTPEAEKDWDGWLGAITAIAGDKGTVVSDRLKLINDLCANTDGCPMAIVNQIIAGMFDAEAE